MVTAAHPAFAVGGLVVDVVASLVGWVVHAIKEQLGADKASKKRRRVVVVGASFAGLAVARDLQHDFDVTVIDQRDFFEYSPGILYCLVHPSHTPSIIVPLSASFPSPSALLAPLLSSPSSPPPPTILARTAVVSVGKHACKTKQGDTVAFDFCVLACGSGYGFPIKPQSECTKRDERVQQVEACADTTRRARSFVVVGGGTVGVELAAELIHKFPARRVSLISRDPVLLPGTPARAQRAVEQWLRSRGVLVFLDDTIEHASPPDIVQRPQFCKDGTVVTASGVRLPAHMVFVCTGTRPNGALLEKSDASLSTQLQNGSILVNDFLQVGDNTNIFAVGDVMRRLPTDLKTAQTAELSALAAAANIRRLARGAPPLAYPASVTGTSHEPRVLCVSLGPRDGVLVFNGVVVCGAVGGKCAAVAKAVVEVAKMLVVTGNTLGRVACGCINVASGVLNRLVPAPAQATSRN